MSKFGLIGYGYTANYFANLLLEKGHEVWGTSRKKSTKKKNLAIVDFSYDIIAKEMINTEFLVISIPPSSGIDPCLNLLEDLLIKYRENFKSIIYLSATSVYGNHNGSWVNEDSSCYANTTRSISRLQAEKSWLSLFEKYSMPVTIFRLTGIYGPGRSPLDRLMEPKIPVITIKNGHYFSRIHVKDICLALYAASFKPKPGLIVNIADDLPCNIYETYKYAAKLLNIDSLSCIPYSQAKLTDFAKEFYDSNKRVSNNRLKNIFLPKLSFPSFKEGIFDIYHNNFK